MKKTDVRIQWDPERTMQLSALPHRTIQIGLRRAALNAYVDEWIVRIEDITDKCKEIAAAVARRDFDTALRYAPIEAVYPLSEELKSTPALAVSR